MWQERVQPGMTVVDIGANVGGMAAECWARMAGTGQMYAIEPQANLTADILTRIQSATVIVAALTDHIGYATLYHCVQSEQATLYPTNVLTNTGRTSFVRATTLDSLTRTGELPARIDFIKVDAQGAEAAILRGASALLAQRHASWYLELWPEGLRNAGDSVAAVCASLKGAGLVPLGRTWEQIDEESARCHGHGALDVLFVPQERC